ncbi:MAG: hypothetical protein ACM3ZA_02480 [Bacillota bacterium]
MARAVTPPSAGWSRPLTIDRAPANGSTTQVSLPDGRLAVIWAADQGFRLYTVAPNGTASAPVSVFPSEASPVGVESVAVGTDVYMFWEDFSTHTLRTAAITPDGSVRAAPRDIVAGVKGYAAAVGGNPSVPHVLTMTGDRLALYGLSPAGAWTVVGSSLPVQGGLALDLQGAQDGSLYGLVATRENQEGNSPVHVLLVRPGAQGTNAAGLDAREVAGFSLETLKEGLSHLSLGLDARSAYAFWDVQRNDRGERTTISQYVTWPLGQPPVQPLQPAGLSPLPGSALPVSDLSTVMPAPGQDARLAAAASAVVGTGRDRAVEIMELTFQDGRLVEQQLAGPSSSMSLQPLLTRSGQDRRLTWVQPRGSSAVLLAGSTMDAFREARAKVNASDWTQAISTAVLNIGFAYLPALISLAWLFPTLMLIAAIYLVALNWAERNGLILNVVGLVVYIALKLYLTQSLLFTPPVLARMPAFMASHVSWLAVATVVAASLELLRKNRRFLQAPVAASLGPLVMYDVVLMALIVAPYVK